MINRSKILKVGIGEQTYILLYSESMTDGPHWEAFRGGKYKNTAFSLLVTLVFHCSMNSRLESRFSDLGGAMFLDASLLILGKKWLRQGDISMKMDAKI